MPAHASATEGPAGWAGVDRSRRLSLRYFNFFRLLLAGIFVGGGQSFGLGGEHPFAYEIASFGYLAAVLSLGFPDAVRRLGLERVILLLILADVLGLSVIMWASGGYRSGMPVLMMVVLAGTGLLAEGRMVLFFAALATLSVLLENAWRFAAGGQPGDFLQVGIFCTGFFGIAIVSRRLALRAQVNALLAAERGQALARQQAVNERIIRDMHDGVIVVGVDGRALQINPQAAMLLGVSRLEGRLLAEVDPVFEEALARGDGLGPRVLRLGPAGRLMRCRTVRSEAGGATGEILIYLTDFEDVERQMQQLKLAALGRLTASMAHEIRNPLSAVTQAAELLCEEKRADMQARLARIINDNAHRIERMIRDVLALGRREHAVPEALPLAAFAAEVIDARVLTDETERAVYALDIGAGFTLGIDRAHLHQILDNLLANARRYCSGQPGSVRLYAEPLAGGRVALHVADDGPGIDAATRSHLFEPFFTTHAKGTGLGLYIARELAEANDAELELHGEGPGADFVLTGRSRP
ncbi:sensor histidine kinase [Thauera sinica]|uniref:histidine kinase n=1 Tax=Thauera sinica TaxID=2665146 RepID=A0ABW1AYS5_9RHOO|nr:ATP-binding protein [Thauera sp. K11]